MPISEGEKLPIYKIWKGGGEPGIEGVKDTAVKEGAVASVEARLQYGILGSRIKRQKKKYRTIKGELILGDI